MPPAHPWKKKKEKKKRRLLFKSSRKECTSTHGSPWGLGRHQTRLEYSGVQKDRLTPTGGAAESQIALLSHTVFAQFEKIEYAYISVAFLCSVIVTKMWVRGQNICIFLFSAISVRLFMNYPIIRYCLWRMEANLTKYQFFSFSRLTL